MQTSEFTVPTGGVPRVVPLTEDKTHVIPLTEDKGNVIPLSVTDVFPDFKGNDIFGGSWGQNDPVARPDWWDNMPVQPKLPEVTTKFPGLAEVINQAVEGKTVPEPDKRKHNHYFKDVSHLDYIDVYRVLKLFNVTDPCLQHALKKVLVAGGRGAKDISKDVQEAIDSCNRFLEMRKEENVAGV